MHPPATQCQSLDSDSARAVPDPTVSDDEPTLGEVRRAIRKLRNGRPAGSDGIQPELLKYAEEPVSVSSLSLCACVEVQSSSCRVARRNHCLTVPQCSPIHGVERGLNVDISDVQRLVEFLM